MTQIGDLTLDLGDPVTLFALALGVLVLVLLILSLHSARRAAKLSEPLVYQLAQVGQRVQSLSDGQERLSGGLTHVSEAQTQSQTAMMQLMERRLAQVQSQMNENLHGSHQAVGRRAVSSGHPVEQADARGVRGNPVDRYCR
jgi:DNA recombination protein RmuC